jgi:hypothetical protein
MTNQIASYAFIFLTIVSSSSQAQTGQLRGCRLTSRTITLQPSQKPVRITGALLKEEKNEYRLKANSDLNVDIRMKTDSDLKLDVYTVKPPAKFKTNGRDWSHKLTSGNEYLVVPSRAHIRSRLRRISKAFTRPDRLCNTFRKGPPHHDQTT